MATLVDLEYAKTHLRVDAGDEDLLIAGQLSAAERLAMSWIRRNIYKDQTALDAAVADVESFLGAAADTYEAALAEAMALPNVLAKQSAISAAQENLKDAQGEAKLTRRGRVLDGLFTSAVLLTLGALYENRELQSPPPVAQLLLEPLRAYG